MLEQVARTNGEEPDLTQLHEDVDNEIRALEETGNRLRDKAIEHNSVHTCRTVAAIGEDNRGDNSSYNDNSSSPTKKSRAARATSSMTGVDKKTITISPQQDAQVGINFEELD